MIREKVTTAGADVGVASEETVLLWSALPGGKGEEILSRILWWAPKVSLLGCRWGYWSPTEVPTGPLPRESRAW